MKVTWREVIRPGSRVKAARAVALLALSAAAAFLPAVAHAAFPGENGRIAFYGTLHPGTYGTPGSAQGIWSVKPDGTGLRPLKLHSNELVESSHSPRWSPDGRLIAYVHALTTGAWVMETMNADGTGSQPLRGPAGASDPNWSPDASMIAYTTVSGRSGAIAVMKRDGTGRRLIATNYASGPAWSPDCSRVAYTSGHGADGQLYTVNPHGRRKRRLTHKTGRVLALRPNWSPDGRQIVYTAYSRDALSDQLVVVGADGSGARMLGIRGRDPAWSPDGREIVFWDPITATLQIVNASGRGRRLLTATGRAYWTAYPDWQPLVTKPPDRTLCARWRKPRSP